MKVAFLIIAGLISVPAFAQKKSKMDYPKTEKGTVVHDYFGTKVEDPYHWLEDDRAPKTEEWVRKQNEFTQNYLQQIPYRTQIREKLESYLNFDRKGSFIYVGESRIYALQKGNENQPTYFIEGLTGENTRVFLHPKEFSEEGLASISILSHDPSNQYVVYSVAMAGSDWQTLRIREVATGRDLPDEIKWVKFSGAEWLENGFFYTCYDAPKTGDELKGTNTGMKVKFHKVGTDISRDFLVFEDPSNPLRYYGLQVSEDKKYLFLTKSTGTDGFETWVCKSEEFRKNNWKAITKGFSNKVSIIDNLGDQGFLALSDKGAPNYQVVVYSPAGDDSFAFKTVIPESKEALLDGVLRVKDELVLTYLENAQTKIKICNLSGQNMRNVDLPGIGTASVSKGTEDGEVFQISFSSFTQPTAQFVFHRAKNAVIEEFYPNFQFNTEVEVQQVWYPSKDGTKVSMFLIHKKGLKKTGNNPTFLYGYGGFNISLTPSFSTNYLWLLEQGGIVAIANLRGGGEYGENWHQAGMKMKKQNVFNDFIAAAEYLIAEKYTSKDFLAIAGGSNGGLLVGACLTQRPDLFKVAFPAVGVLDMLRYQKFTVGWGWVPEYGSSEDSKEMFEYLIRYSPLHALKPKTNYPATMVTTGDHDDRVVPAHSFKFAARLQECQAGPAPALIRIDVNAGHGAGKPLAKVLDENADKWAFMLWNMGIKTIK
jgi:prolyl oligopeptidase